jgi:hypothetical protein
VEFLLTEVQMGFGLKERNFINPKSLELLNISIKTLKKFGNTLFLEKKC